MAAMNILFITHNRLGDAVLSSGIYGHLAERHPQARFTVACGPAPAPLFAGAPNLHRLIVLEKQALSAHWLKLWLAVCWRYWHTVVDLRGSAIAWLLPTARRHVLQPRPDPVHRVRMLADLLDLAEPPAPALWTTAAQEAAAAELLPGDRPVLALGPTANWGGKQWPGERFAELATRLTGDTGILADARIAVFGAPHERAAAQAVIDRLPRERVVDLAGAIDLPTVYACLKRSALYVGNDSGLMHMAAATGTPTVGLFGPSREELYGPWGANCVAVRTARSFDEIVNDPAYDYRKHDSWMLDLEVERAEQAATALYRRCRAEAA
jgi:heptosyltransferase-3